MQSSRKKVRGAAIKSGLSSAFEPTDSQCRRSSARLSRSPHNERSTQVTSMTPEDQAKILPISSGKKQKKLICRLMHLPEVMIHYIFSFFVSSDGIDLDSYTALLAVNKMCRDMIRAPVLWKFVSLSMPDNSLNWNALQYIKTKCKGTEGTCYHAVRRTDNAEVALKKARVYPNNEGVPYYMIREISTLKKLSHPKICRLEMVTIKDFKLHLMFPYFEHTLHDFLSPSDAADDRRPPKKHQTLSIMHQICSAVGYLHRRGILHRNLKPKHLLVRPGPCADDPLENAVIQLADFALVRTLSTPPKNLTSEVITLWYRPPEILMGQRDYTAAVDVWSLGCIFAEMLQGKALFEGLCEIDQLFQIFHAMGTPAEDQWAHFSQLPYFQLDLFPHWQHCRLRLLIPNATSIEFDLLAQCLVYDPARRIAAEDLLQMPYFTDFAVDRSAEEIAVLECIRADSAAVDSAAKAVVMETHRMKAEGGLVHLLPTTLPQHQFLKSLEEDMLVSASTVDTTRTFTADDMASRCMLVESLLRISGATSSMLSSRTSYFAMALADAFFASVEKLKSSSLSSMYKYSDTASVVGACCMHIASKCEDVSYVGIRDVAYLLNMEYDLSHFLSAEETILNVLGFDLYMPTVIDFLGIYLECVPEICDKEPQKSLCLYLGHLALYHGMCFQYKPSHIAAAIVAYAIMYDATGSRNKDARPLWPASLSAVSSLSYEKDICPCITVLSNYQRMVATVHPSSPVTSIRQSYAVSSYHSVSLWHWLQ